MGNFLLPQENYHYFECPCFSFILNQGLKAKTMRVFCLKMILQSCQCCNVKHFSCKLKFWGKKLKQFIDIPILLQLYSETENAVDLICFNTEALSDKKSILRHVSQVAVIEAGWELSKISLCPLYCLPITPTLLSAACQYQLYHWGIKIKRLLYQPADSELIKLVEGAAVVHSYT